VEGALLDYALFWEDCSYCDSASPPPVKNRGTLYEDLILRVTYVGGKWVVRVLWGQGGFGHEVYVNGSLLYRKPPGYAGEPGVWGEYVGTALEVRLVSLGDSRADAAALFTAFDRAHEALACAAALGLDAKETNGLLRHFGVSGEVVRVRRGDGGAAFVFRNGSAVSVPLVLDVDVGQWGRFVLVNPCGAAVNWTLRLYADNKTLGSKPGGRLAAEVPADMAPYSVAPVYVFGVAEESGLYRVSYRLYVRPGVYDVWGYRVVVDRERLAAANGSFANWVWGFFESLAGRAAGDRCAEARGAGRMWVAERIGWAGVATEVDTALGGAALFFSAGIYGEGRTAAKGAAEAVKVAGEAARGYKAARAVAYAYRLWQGVLLGWDVYLSVARGEVPVEALGAAVASVGGRVGERVRLVYSLATGGLLLMNLGHVPEMEELVGSIYGEASKYGEYAHCFVDGALGAFDAYAKEVLANQLVGVFSTFLDIDKVLNNKAYKGYLQLAAHSAFNYESPFPIYSKDQIGGKLGKYEFVAVGKQKLGISYDSNIEKLVELTEERKGREYRLRSLSRDITIVKAVQTTEGDFVWRLVRYQRLDDDQTFLGVRVIVNEKPVLFGYNDALVAVGVTKGVQWGAYRDFGSVKLGTVEAGKLAATIRFKEGFVDKDVFSELDTLFKYLTGPLLHGWLQKLKDGMFRPQMLGYEVGLPGEVREVKMGGAFSVEGLSKESQGVFILTGRSQRPDLFGIADDGSLIWVEVKVPSSVSSVPQEFVQPVAERATALLNFINTEKRADVFLAAVASAFAGVGGGMSVNNRISSAFSMAPNFVLPKLKGENTQVWFALVLVDGRGDSYKYAVYLTKATLRDLRNEEWVYNLYSNAEKDFKGTVVDSGDDVSALWRSYVDSVLSAVGK
jgi:hypothetical protein